MAGRFASVESIDLKASEIELDTTENGFLGSGGYGKVIKGFYRGKQVAVKQLVDKGHGFVARDKIDLQKEARGLLFARRHNCIIDFYGIVLEESLNALILEYMHFGDVYHFLKHLKVQDALKVSIVNQVISGMLFLHSNRVRHLDMKAENVLVNNYFNAKICDFGLSKLKTITVSATQDLGLTKPGRRCTLTHIAPEVLCDINIEETFEQDIYAFAVTIWEVFTGKRPFENISSDDLIKSSVKDGQRPNIRAVQCDPCTEEVKHLIEICWNQNPSERPTFKVISEEFNTIYCKYEAQIDPAKLCVRQDICRKYRTDDEQYACTNHFDTAVTSKTVTDHDPENSLPGPSLFSAKVVQNKTDQECTPKPPNPELNLDIQQTAKESHNKSPEKTSPDGLRTPLANMNINDKRLQTPTGGGNQGASKRVNFPNDLELNGATGYTPIPGTQENVEDDDITQLKRAAKQKSNADVQEPSLFRGLQDPAIGNHFARNSNRIVADTNSGNDRRFAQLEPDRWSNLQVASQVPRVDVRAEGSNIQDPIFPSKMNGTMLTVDQLSATSKAFGSHSHGGQGQAGGQVPVSTHREQSIEGDMKEGVTVVGPPPEGGSNAGSANQQPQVGIVGGVNTGLASQQPQVGNVDGVNTGLASQQPQVGNVGGVNTGLAHQQPQVGNVGGVNTGLASQQPQVGNVGGVNTGLASQQPQVGNVGGVNTGLAHQQPQVGNVEIGTENFPSQRNTSGFVSPTVTNNSRYPRQIFGQTVQNPHVVPPTIFGQQMPLVTGYQRPHDYEAAKPDIQDPALPQATGLGANANTVNTRNTTERTPFQPSSQIPTATSPAHPPFQPHSMTGGNSPQGSFQSYQHQHPSYCVPVVRPSVTTQNQPGSFQGQAPFNPGPRYTPVGPPQLPVYNGTYGTQTGQHVGAPQGPHQNMAGGYRGQQTAQQGPQQTAWQTSGPSQNYGTSSSHGDRNNSATGSSSKKSKPKQTRSQDDIKGEDFPSLEGASMMINHRHAGGGFSQIVLSQNMTVPPNIQIGNNNQMVVNEAGDHDIDGASSGDNIESRKKTKCKTSKLSKSEEKLSQSQVDMVAADIGKHWRKLCRQLGFTEAEVEQLHFDHHHAGLYEMMYQGIRKWQQKNGRQATEKVMARCLWNIDKVDIALRLPTVHD